MAAVFIFMELSLEKSTSFAQLVNKLHYFLVHIIRMLDGENENAHKYSDREEERGFCHTLFSSEGDGQEQVTTGSLSSPLDRQKGGN